MAAATAHVGAAVGAHADRVRQRVVALDAVEVDDLGRLGLRRGCRRLVRRLLAAASGQRDQRCRYHQRSHCTGETTRAERGAHLDFEGVPLVRDFPLFPLGLVALPTELVPLHIFEERYKTMIGRCLEEESEFGIVWMAEDGLRPIGCACEIAEVVERMDDGRINLIARGTRAFRIETRQEELPYPAGTVEFLDDRSEDDDAEAAEAAHAAYAELVNEATDRDPDMDEIGAMSAYQMAATVEFGLDAKQGLLDLRSESARLRLVTRLFRAAIKRLDFVNRAQARARSNGRVHFQP